MTLRQMEQLSQQNLKQHYRSKNDVVDPLYEEWSIYFDFSDF